ncbi:BBM_1a_G0022990.mRNA.1.CDS.1 [Saccharomyces cerevisiae]|nr:CPI_1c_G0023010.mRNA.1.CDS.1 [Saccharomyces cerevisiae]CAI4507594.1 BBM_1a_G0022990.mRNA.1.CDS.1 [Saccharomyces cerevisiae]CAI7142551.1 BBM_1a_G0022990.mRNA.1.CDS.1 [Saccharomyces cerevisiae]CAI7324176.1 CPI_1c_G0023010.mRNA.1.CDS.1 [Saccharomyces cerevisiae]
MSENQRLGLSEEEVEAAEVLGVLKQSCRQKPQRSEDVSHGDQRSASESSTTPLNILDRVSNKIISNVVTFYDEINTNKRPLKSIGRLLDDDDDEHDDYDYNDDEFFTNKRQKLSQAIAKGKDNLKEYKLNMSIESKKRLVTCLHLLKLANKQLSDKVSCLQDLVEKEQVHPLHKQDGSAGTTAGAGEDDTSSDEDDDDDEFFDASEQVNASEQSIVVKMEVVGTVKKVYSLISKFTANSLPEPARSQVRESLLNLPTNWFDSVHSTSLPHHASFHYANCQEPNVELQQQQQQQQQQRQQQQQQLLQQQQRKRVKDVGDTPPPSSSVTPNGKVLILAKESLEMVRNVMGVVDSTLGKAEEWVKQKQEVKEMIRERFLQQQQQYRQQQQKDGNYIKPSQDNVDSKD